MRTRNPFYNTKNWNNRINRSGRYWHLPMKSILNFDEKLKFEYSKINKYLNKKLFKKLRNQEVLNNLNYPIKFL